MTNQRLDDAKYLRVLVDADWDHFCVNEADRARVLEIAARLESGYFQPKEESVNHWVRGDLCVTHDRPVTECLRAPSASPEVS